MPSPALREVLQRPHQLVDRALSTKYKTANHGEQYQDESGKTWMSRCGGLPFIPKVVEVPYPAVAPVWVTCVAGEPQPKVLPILGLNNDQIYENPSEQFVPHITGTVTRGWGGGTADITYKTDAGWVFADGSTEKVVIVDGIEQDRRDPAPGEPADQLPAPGCVRLPG